MTAKAERQRGATERISRPTGKSAKTCPVPFEKIFCFSEIPNHLHNPRHPVPLKGRFAIVTNAGRAAVDAGCASDESTAFADGEVVWAIFWCSVKHAEAKKTLQNKHF
jgi:hypothetical protein